MLFHYFFGILDTPSCLPRSFRAINIGWILLEQRISTPLTQQSLRNQDGYYNILQLKAAHANQSCNFITRRSSLYNGLVFMGSSQNPHHKSRSKEYIHPNQHHFGWFVSSYLRIYNCRHQIWIRPVAWFKATVAGMSKPNIGFVEGLRRSQNGRPAT